MDNRFNIKGDISMKKLASAVAVLLAVFCICFAVSACDESYNAVVIDSGIEFTSDFLNNSITYGAWCDKEDYDPEVDEERGWYDSQSPETRTYIVREQSEAEQIFTELPAVDFENKTLLVYCWTEIYNSRPVILKSVRMNKNGTLKIEFELKKPTGHVGDASMPMRRILVVKIDKLDFSSVEFSQIK